MNLAQAWLGQLGAKLVDKVKAEEVRIFNDELEGGKRLTYNEIRRLNTVFKKQYVNAITKDDDLAREYIHAKQA